MEQTNLNSTNIKSTFYDIEMSILKIEFFDGSITQYYHIQEDEYKSLINAENIDKYFSDNIKDNYNYEIIQESIEPDVMGFWERKQRDLVTSFVDYNLLTLTQLISDKIIDLKPEYQRRFRWDKKRQSKLIESFFMNVPVPPIFLNEDDYGKYSVIDGKQRLTAIHSFLTGKLKLEGLDVFSELNGLKYNKINPKFQNIIKTRAILRAIIILRQSDNDIKYEVFQRLNTGGVSLNPQEIRNSAYPGTFNDVILALSEDTLFHTMLRIDNPKQSKFYQEMKDVELVLRFFTFKDDLNNFSGNTSRKMDRFMHENQRISSNEQKKLKSSFLSTIKLVKKIFGVGSFVRWDLKKERWANYVSASIYDAQMFSCYNYIENPFREFDQKKYIIEYKKLFSDDIFQDAITYHTNSARTFELRINLVHNLIVKFIKNQ